MLSAKNSVQCLFEDLLVTILDGESLSSEIDLKGLRLFNLALPASASSNLTLSFQAYNAGLEEWVNVFKDGVEYTKTLNKGTEDDLDFARFAAIKRLKIRVGTAAAPQSVVGDTNLSLILRSL